MQRSFASFTTLGLVLASTAALWAAPPEQDRKAILAMAGSFHVDFQFTELAPVAADYTPLSKPYHEEAFEQVLVVEDTPERITLQHLLVVGKPEDPRVIKHWTQIWTWQDTELLDYSGSEGNDVWTHHSVSTSDAEGKWSQLVTSVDDTPRYEALGRWTHDLGVSSWTSEPTRRPQPRREYQEFERSDYDYLLGINRHTLTNNGWVHFQDNRKVVDRDGKKFALSFETGINQYTRTENPFSQVAIDWWSENSEFWNIVRNFWLENAQKPSKSFRYKTLANDESLTKTFGKINQAGFSQESITTALAPFVEIE